jgi:hypothetical protein
MFLEVWQAKDLQAHFSDLWQVKDLAQETANWGWSGKDRREAGSAKFQ